MEQRPLARHGKERRERRERRDRGGRVLDNDTVGTEVNKIQKPGPLSSGFDSNSLLPGPGTFTPPSAFARRF